MIQRSAQNRGVFRRGIVAEQAGGSASNGSSRILDIVPEKLHQRTPLIIGSRDDVAFVERTLSQVEAGVA